MAENVSNGGTEVRYCESLVRNRFRDLDGKRVSHAQDLYFVQGSADRDQQVVKSLFIVR